uniref:Uncharacterized protein n=1 Tax=Anguilla anguilla TaxID=7936 RepID=A0A0E9V435_ANGAN
MKMIWAGKKRNCKSAAFSLCSCCGSTRYAV